MNKQQQAAKAVSEIFAKYYGLCRFAEAQKIKDDFVQEVVTQLGRLMRPVAEEQVKSSGWLSPDEFRQATDRNVNAGIADYCRHRRLALADVRVPIDTPTIIAMLALDEAHYSRLANRPTKAEEQVTIKYRRFTEPINHDPNDF